MTFRVECEYADGRTRWATFTNSEVTAEWRNPEDADLVAEGYWLQWNGDTLYRRFSVIEQDGSVYSDWEV